MSLVLGEGLVEKLKAAGVNTVEALADMTPEQLEAIEGIGPKTVEKISIAVNNYFASLDGGEAVAAAGSRRAEFRQGSEAVGEASVQRRAGRGCCGTSCRVKSRQSGSGTLKRRRSRHKRDRSWPLS